MSTSAARSPFGDLAALVRAQGLPPVPLPADVAGTMQAHGEDCFASEDMRGEWRSGAPLREVAQRWLDQGCSAPGARGELAGYGFHSHFLQVAIETPRYGLFVRKLVSQAFDDAAINRRRVEGTFGLMQHLLHAIGNARAWSAGQRLVVVDDDESALLHWGWVTRQGARWEQLAPDAAAWISALMAVEGMAR